MSSLPDREIVWPVAEDSLPLVLAAPDKEEWRQGVENFLRSKGEPWTRSITFATSGSSGGTPKGVVFFPTALEASARGVNQWLGADKGGDWCCPLLPYHVGGYMIYVRAALAGTRVHSFVGKWEPERFAKFVEETQSAWSSLVPTQVVDIVNSRVKAPSCLRTVVVGGGALASEIGEEARQLGWPVVQSYGMTESASQIATARLDEPYTGQDMPILPHWDVRVSDVGRTMIKGVARFAAYVKLIEGEWCLEVVPGEDYWEAKDMISIKQNKLTFLRRADRIIKILGELVDVDGIESEFAQFLPGSLLCALPHLRNGMALYACHPNELLLSEAIQQWNHQCSGLHRIESYVVTEIPRNPMGKIDRKGLERICLERYKPE